MRLLYRVAVLIHFVSIGCDKLEVTPVGTHSVMKSYLFGLLFGHGRAFARGLEAQIKLELGDRLLEFDAVICELDMQLPGRGIDRDARTAVQALREIALRGIAKLP